jgi:hypothetical protein
MRAGEGCNQGRIFGAKGECRSPNARENGFGQELRTGLHDLQDDVRDEVDDIRVGLELVDDDA